MQRLVSSIAAGVPAETVAAAIRERESEIAGLDKRLVAPKRERPDIDRLRDALTQRAEQWKADLRAEPALARLVVRRLVKPLVLWDPAADPCADSAEWSTSVKPGLLDGLVHLGTSSGGT